MFAKYISFAVLCAVCLVNTGIAGAPTTYTSKTGSWNWSNSSAWNPAGVPNSSTDVVIAAGSTVTVDGNFGALSLTINGGTGGNLIIPAGDSLYVFNLTRMLAPNSGVTTTITLAGKLATSGVNTSSVSLLGTAASPTKIVFGVNGVLYDNYNLNCTGAGAVIDMTSGGILRLKGTYTNSGTLTPGAGTFAYVGAGTNQSVLDASYNNLELGGDHTKNIGSVTVNGALSMSGTCTLSNPVTYGPSASLIYRGTSAQTTGIELPSTMSNPVQIDNPDGVTLSQSTSFSGGITCTQGAFETQIYTVTLTGGTLSEISESEIMGNVAASATLVQNVNFDFYGIGLEVKGVSKAPGYTEVTRVTGTAQTGDGYESIKRYFTLQPTVTVAVNAEVILHYFDSELNGQTAGNMEIITSPDYGTTWIGIGGIDNPSTRTIKSLGTNDWGIYTAISPATPLAIHLREFTGSSSSGGVNLEWSTTTETGNLGFYVERGATEGGPFAVLSGLIPGAGTSLEEHSYSFTDHPPAGTFYYRIRDENAGGRSSYSTPIKVVVTGVTAVSLDGSAPKAFALRQNYPNPFNPATTIKFSVDQEGPARLRVFNSAGQLVRELFNGSAAPGTEYTVILNASGLASGTYYCTLTTQQRTETREMLLVK